MSDKKKNTSPNAAAANGGAAKKKREFCLSRLVKGLSVKARRILCIALSACLLLGACIGGFFIYRAHAGYNYIEAELSRYVSLSAENFKKISLPVSVDKPTEEDLAWSIVQLQVDCIKDSDLVVGGDPENDPIGAGSVITLYFVGYTVSESGMREYFSGGSNLTDSSPKEITVGRGEMIADLEKGLIGICPSDTEKPTLISSGKVEEGDTVYVQITGSDPNGSGFSSEAQPLLVTPALDETYGEGFYELLLGSTLGKRTFEGYKLLPGKDGEFLYFSVRPLYKSEGGRAVTVPVRFPADYQTGSPLNGKEAFFDVYVLSNTSYHLPEYNDAFLTDRVKLVPEQYKDYEGETLAQRFKAAVWEELMADYEDRLLAAAEESFWKEIVKIASVSHVPRAAINEEYDTYLASMRQTYEDYLESASLTSGEYSFKTFAKEYLSLEKGESYRSYVRRIAEQTAREKMIFFYAIRLMGAAPTEAELNEEFDQTLTALAKKSYGLDEGLYENDSYTAEQRLEAYKEYLEMLNTAKEKTLEAAGEEYFLESAYYNLGFPRLLSMVKVTYNGKGHG